MERFQGGPGLSKNSTPSNCPNLTYGTQIVSISRICQIKVSVNSGRKRRMGGAPPSLSLHSTSYIQIFIKREEVERITSVQEEGRGPAKIVKIPLAI